MKTLERICGRRATRGDVLSGGLAALYQVETRHLNQQVKRNPDRFPAQGKRI
jgi:hypothetical protein